MEEDNEWGGDHSSESLNTIDYNFPVEYFSDNVSLIPRTNRTGNDTDLDYNLRITYITVPLLLITLCIVAIAINIRILLCVKWIRRPLSPTIYISLSLAAADTLTAILIGLGFVLNSLLPKGFTINIENTCFLLSVEAFRLSGILISTIHLLALAGNHYFGILCPFRSMTLLTPGNVKMVVGAIWFLPTAYIFAYFGSAENQGFQRRDCHIDTNFVLYYTKFRTIFSALFFIPMVLMFGIYIHISMIVKRHQANRQWFNRHSRRQETMALSGSGNDQQRQLDRNLKAMWTSLLILSTYVICFMPAVITFYLICRDCYILLDSVDRTTVISISSVNNFLLITKYLLNPLIYASRMQEIKLATKQMDAEWRRVLCSFGRTDDLDLGPSNRVEGSQRFSLFSSSSRRQNIALNSIQIRNGADRPTRQSTDV